VADTGEIKHKMLAARVLAAEKELAELRALLLALAIGTAEGNAAAAQSVRDALEDDARSRRTFRESIDAGPPPDE
jgi:hypothetical protein